VHVFRAIVFDAFDADFFCALLVIAGIASVAPLLGTFVGRWCGVPARQWRPPLDIE
jgi:hypothetical protein